MGTYTITTEAPVAVTLAEYGHGRAFLVLHGGAGPLSVEGFGRLLAEQRGVRALVPTHPGFNRTQRPSWLSSPRQLAAVYVGLLDQLGLDDVVVLGSSIGGWVAAEVALLASPRVSGVVIVDAVGIEVTEHPVADFFALSFDELARLSYHDPERFGLDPSTMTDEQRATLAANREAIAVYGGPTMHDPTLRGRLAAVSVPTLVVWGEDDGIATPAYGRALADAIPTATFTLMHGAGHLPQLETPQLLLERVGDFAERQAPLRPRRAS